jgi:hypothetical protein
VGPRAGLDDVEKRNFLTLPRLELRPLGRPVRSQSLYRLRYPFIIEITKESCDQCPGQDEHNLHTACILQHFPLFESSAIDYSGKKTYQQVSTVTDRCGDRGT